MKLTKSIKHQVVLKFVSFTLLLSVFFVCLTVLLAYIVEDEVIDRLLGQEVAYLQESYLRTGLFPAARLDYMHLHYDKKDLPQPISIGLEDKPAAREFFTTGAQHYHIAYLKADDIAANGNNAPILVADVRSLLSVTNMSGDILLLMSVFVVLAMLLAAWLAYRIANASTRSIVRLSNELQTLSNPQQIFSESIMSDKTEIGFLAVAIASNFKDLHAALQRERDFTRDVSHELRTPLTIVTNTLALIEHRDWDAKDKIILDKAVSQMQDTVVVLLMLARQENLEFGSFLIRPVLEESIIALQNKLSERGFSVELKVKDDSRVEANKELLVLMLNNLIDNAIQHASEAKLVISMHENHMIFTNAGDVQLLGDPTLAKFKSSESEGMGQGLYLVKRIATALGWQLKVQNEGCQFKLTLFFSALRK